MAGQMDVLNMFSCLFINKKMELSSCFVNYYVKETRSEFK